MLYLFFFNSKCQALHKQKGGKALENTDLTSQYNPKKILMGVNDGKYEPPLTSSNCNENSCPALEGLTSYQKNIDDRSSTNELSMMGKDNTESNRYTDKGVVQNSLNFLTSNSYKTNLGYFNPSP